MLGGLVVDCQGKSRSSMDGDASLMGKPVIAMATPCEQGSLPAGATGSRTAHSSIRLNPTKLPSQMQIQTFLKEKKTCFLEVYPYHELLNGLLYINIISPCLTLPVKDYILVFLDSELH